MSRWVMVFNCIFFNYNFARHALLTHAENVLATFAIACLFCVSFKFGVFQFAVLLSLSLTIILIKLISKKQRNKIFVRGKLDDSFGEINEREKEEEEEGSKNQSRTKN